jgi:hypothetical protein
MGYPHAFLASRLRPVHAFMSGFQNAEIHREHLVESIPIHALEQ